MGSFDTSSMPPHGWVYREALTNWTPPNPFLPFKMIVAQIQTMRANNPASQLDSSFRASSDALKLYTRTRLNDVRWGDELEVITPSPAKKKKKCPGCSRKA